MKIPTLVVLLIICLTTLAVLSPGCVTQSPIEQAVTASEVTSTGEPKTMTDTFAPDVSTIYCSVKLATTSIKSTVKAEWYVVKSDEAALINSMISQGKVVAGTPYVVLAFTRSDRLLPKGDYEVKIYFDDKFTRSVPFKVQGQAAVSRASLSEAVLCTNIDLLTNKPLNKVDVFPNDVSIIFCSFKVNDANFNTNIKARWTYISGEIDSLKGKVIYEPSTKAEGMEYLSFSIGMPAGKQLPMGEYKIALFIEDKEQVVLPFKVVDPGDIKWPYISEVSIFAYSEQDPKAIIRTAQFPSNTKEINLRAKAYNAPPGTELRTQWVLARSSDGVWADQLIKEDKNSIEGTIEIWGSIAVKKDPFIKGDYLVKLLVNGQEMISVPFRVQ